MVKIISEYIALIEFSFCCCYIFLYHKHRCTAQNTYSHSKPSRTFSTSLEVINSSESQLKSGLLPLLLENNSIEIKTGENLNLICVAYSENVRWTFRQRNRNESININSTSSVLVFRNVSFAAHDGFYNCSTTTDFQVNFPTFSSKYLIRNSCIFPVSIDL